MVASVHGVRSIQIVSQDPPHLLPLDLLDLLEVIAESHLPNNVQRQALHLQRHVHLKHAVLLAVKLSELPCPTVEHSWRVSGWLEMPSTPLAIYFIPKSQPMLRT